MVIIRRQGLHLGHATGPIPLNCENILNSGNSLQSKKPGTVDLISSNDAAIINSSHRSFMSANIPPTFTPTMLPPYSSYMVSQASNPQQDQAATSMVLPLPGIIDPSDNRMWIEPTNSSFLPFDDVQPIISLIINKEYELMHTSYPYMMKELKRNWFKELKKKCKWLPQYDRDVRRTWSKKTATIVDRARIKFNMGKDLSVWLPAAVLEHMKRKWGDRTSEDNSKKKKNKKSVDDGGSLNTGGPVAISDHNEDEE